MSKHREALDKLKETEETREREAAIKAKVAEVLRTNEILKQQYDTLQKENLQLLKQIQMSVTSQFPEKAKTTVEAKVPSDIQVQKGKLHQETEALLRKMNETLGLHQTNSYTAQSTAEKFSNLLDKYSESRDALAQRPSTKTPPSRGYSFVDNLFPSLNYTPKNQRVSPSFELNVESPSTSKVIANDMLGQLKFSKLLNTPTSHLTSKRNVTSSRDLTNYNRSVLADISNNVERKAKPKAAKPVSSKQKTSKAARRA